jgi:hypothetical protein
MNAVFRTPEAYHDGAPEAHRCSCQLARMVQVRKATPELIIILAKADFLPPSQKESAPGTTGSHFDIQIYYWPGPVEPVKIQ